MGFLDSAGVVRLWAKAKATFSTRIHSHAEYQAKTFPDTRSRNESPQWYMTNYPRQGIVEFKSSSTMGLSGETFAVLITTVPWSDSSGGYPKQVALVAGKLYWRIGVSATAWGTWSSSLSATEASSTYVKSLSVSGRTITYVRGNGTSGTITTQDTNTTYSAMAGSTASAAGRAGLAPAPAAGVSNRFLRCDGTWQVPPVGSTTDYRPKNSIYLTKGSESPASLFGGSWAKRTDTYLFMGYRVWERVG